MITYLLRNEVILKLMSFTSLGLDSSLVKATEFLGYKSPYPIQKQAIPAILQRKDVLGIAKTGSGKTASYVLPILQNLQSLRKEKNRNVSILVVIPTRELAVQVEEVFKELASYLQDPIKVMAVYGGVSINPQMKALYGVNILVATPGRLLDLVDTKAVHLSSVSTLVLDEADKMLNLGFKEEMDHIFSLLPSSRQNLLFSATLNEAVDKINRVLLTNPQLIKIDEGEDNIDQIKQLAYSVPLESKGPLLRYLLNQCEGKQVLIFTSSTRKADNVGQKLAKNGITCAVVHSKKSQGARTTALKEFKEGKLKILIATDLLSRGIDMEALPYVINYELPRSPKDYIHRIGRTGRAEATGEAISLITPEDEHHFKVIQKKMGKKVSRVNFEDIILKK